MRKLFRVVTAIPCCIFLQSIGTLAFTLFGLIPFMGLIVGIGNLCAYLGTGEEDYLSEAKFSFKMLISLFGGSLVCYSWIQTGYFDMENLGMTHLKNK